jgi:hypothetical protein
MSLSIPSTGSINFSTLANVYGLSGPPYRLSSLKRGGGYVPNIPENNNISTTNNNLNISGFKGSSVQINVTLTNTTNLNLYTLFNSLYSFPSRKYAKFTIPNGVIIGATSTGDYALTIGSFPTDAILTVDIYGSVQGAGGAAGSTGIGGTGGPAINADLSVTSTYINIKPGGSVYGGGGGGGKGGTGGKGADGKPGSAEGLFYDVDNYWFIGSTYYNSPSYAVYNIKGYNARQGTTLWSNGASTLYVDMHDGTGNMVPVTDYQQRWDLYLTITGTPGIGGAGGAGGAGGRGAGYNQTALTGSPAAAAAAGTTGTWGAGNGGTGGKGGTGGTGGALGTSGSTGTDGVSGTAGAAGGVAGLSIYKPSRTNVTVTIELTAIVLPAVTA